MSMFWDNGSTVPSVNFIQPVIPDAALERLTASAPACSVQCYLTDLDSTSNAVAATLADGLVHGQLKRVQATVVTNATTLSITSAVSTSLDVVTFTVIGDYVDLIWNAEDGYWQAYALADEDGDLDTPTIG